MYQYKSKADYLEAQIDATRRKKDKVWAREENIKAISSLLADKYKTFIRGICHGVRTGKEVEWFFEHLPYLCVVIGTEIGEISSPLVVMHDMTERKEEWVGYFDFVYSNSFDHAYPPDETFRVWMEQLKPGGTLILEYDERNQHDGVKYRGANRMDPVSVKIEEMSILFTEWSDDIDSMKTIALPETNKGWNVAIWVEKRDD